MSKDLKVLQEKFPFLTLFSYSNEEYIGIVQNHGKNVVSVYVLNKISDKGLRKKFIEMGEIWWTESNRKIPINLFFKKDFNIFQQFMTNFITKEFKVIEGQIVSLNSLNQKRTKRRRVEMVVNPNK